MDLYLFAGFVGGLLALFTPCVWPIIPMTVSFFLKRTKDKRKGIRDAWTYGASIVVIYVTLGLAITLIFGASALNDLSTSAVFNILFFLMLVVFAASFFGAFEITLPSKWSNAVDSKAEQTTGLLSISLWLSRCHWFLSLAPVRLSVSCWWKYLLLKVSWRRPSECWDLPLRWLCRSPCLHSSRHG